MVRYAEPALPYDVVAAFRRLSEYMWRMGYSMQASALLRDERSGERHSLVLNRGEWQELVEDDADGR